ncbi:MAG: hypothetical protein RDU24_12420 [Humidesulfovibrio sp.]|uniref:hypothetical protein n=1 Tax=Humidesulfovibrio sp. TaxID=2910988 RepID=UPI0027FB7378|nr:hypothetical protein [Humidesulfovibrio sp.]MDQ7836179.1 hypothetical protein [Humidesulfovibrio sp.]
MQGAWYVVEVYCFFSVLHLFMNVAKHHDEPVRLALDLGWVALVLLLSWLTFRAKRLASRILAVIITYNAVGFVWINVIQPQRFDIYLAYQMIIQSYFFGGSIKLWRIKELPTRFTDPPAAPPAHA